MKPYQPEDEEMPSGEERISVTEQIEQYAFDTGLDVISAAVELAQQNGWEPDWLAPYIHGPLKEKMRAEGERTGLLKRTTLPMFQFE